MKHNNALIYFMIQLHGHTYIPYNGYFLFMKTNTYQEFQKDIYENGKALRVPCHVSYHITKIYFQK